jgi:hypothetical protein
LLLLTQVNETAVPVFPLCLVSPQVAHHHFSSLPSLTISGPLDSILILRNYISQMFGPIQ